MAFDGNGGRSRNYGPNSHGGPAPTGAPFDHAMALSGSTGQQGYAVHPEDDDFAQAGMLYRLMSENQKARLVASLAGGVAQVSRPAVIDRSVGHFAKADAELGRRLAVAIADRQRQAGA